MCTEDTLNKVIANVYNDRIVRLAHKVYLCHGSDLIHKFCSPGMVLSDDVIYLVQQGPPLVVTEVSRDEIKICIDRFNAVR